MKKRWKALNMVLMLVLLTGLTGCFSQFGEYDANSHFAYPNSNVTALGPVQASVTKFGFVIGTEVDKAFVMEVYNEALKKSGGDLIIDFKFDTSTNMIWPISWTTLTVDGTAAKMVIGKKELK